MSIGMKIFIGISVIGELFYWLVWFPKAWKTGATKEIRDLKVVTKEMGKFYRDGMKRV